MNPSPKFRWIQLKRKKLVLIRIAAGTLTALGLAGPVRAQRLVAWPMARPPAALPLPRPPAPLPSPTEPGSTILRPLPPGDSPTPLEVTLPPQAVVLPVRQQGMKGTIGEDVARLTLEVVFYNDGGSLLEGDLYLPIPKDVVFDSLELHAGGKVLKAELLDAAQARATYEGIVRQLRDPALLELVNDHLARARVFPIPPRSEVKLRFSYSQTVSRSGNLRELHVPVVHFADPASRAEQRVAELRLETARPLRLVYSPTHAIAVQRHGERRATLTYDAGAGVQRSELVLMFSVDEGPMSVSLSAHRERGGDGYFLLSLDPRHHGRAPATPKDVVFALDRSASMADDDKFGRLRRAVAGVLQRLEASDRFGIVDFGTGVQTFREQLVPADKQSVAAALDYIRDLEVSGGTNISGALTEGLRLLRREPGRLPVVVFITDGRPTVGETGSDAVLKAFRDGNRAVQARFFAFGIGPDLNAALLDRLADAEQGIRDYVLPGEDLELKLSRLYDRIAKPALTDVTLRWEGVAVRDLTPRKVSDLYFGDPLVLLGRYRAGGRGTLRIEGTAGGRKVAYSVPVTFPERADGKAFLPRLWAHRRVAQLMDDIRLAGAPNDEISEEIARLGKKYGIVTPYTSFIAMEDTDWQALRGRVDQGLRRMADEAAGAPAADGILKSAARALSFSRDIQGMISGAAGALGDGGFGADAPAARADRPERRADNIRRSGGKTFYWRGDRWLDSELELEPKPRPSEAVPAFSPRYFELVRRHPELAQVLADGSALVVVLDGKTYHFIDQRR